MNEKKKKFKFDPNPKPFRPKPFGHQKPSTRRVPFTPYRVHPQHPSQKPEQEEKPYWTAEQWEEWATNQFLNNPDAIDFLPEWFLNEQEDEKDE